MKLARPHEVKRQTKKGEELVCCHLLEVTAELHAWCYRRRDRQLFDVSYIVRRAGDPLPRYDLVHDPDDAHRQAIAEEQTRAARVERNEQDPDAVIVTEKRLRPWYVSQLLRTVHVVDGKAVDEDGTVVPGLGVRPGGVPKSLSFRPSADAEDVAAQAAVSIVDEIAAKLGMSGAPS